MDILLFRGVLASALVLLVSLAARRLGPRAAGQLLGSPTTTGPFQALLCMTSGTGGGGTGHARQHHRTAGRCDLHPRLRMPRPRLRPALTLLLALGCAAAVGGSDRSTVTRRKVLMLSCVSSMST